MNITTMTAFEAKEKSRIKTTFSMAKLGIGFYSDGFYGNEFQIEIDSNNNKTGLCKSGGQGYAITKGMDGKNRLTGQKEEK